MKNDTFIALLCSMTLVPRTCASQTVKSLGVLDDLVGSGMFLDVTVRPITKKKGKDSQCYQDQSS
jgi:hypothetical protein